MSMRNMYTMFAKNNTDVNAYFITNVALLSPKSKCLKDYMYTFDCNKSRLELLAEICAEYRVEFSRQFAA